MPQEDEIGTEADEPQVIDGGSVAGAPPVSTEAGGEVQGDAGVHVDKQIEKDRADMAIRLARLVIWALIATVAVHYGSTTALNIFGYGTVAERLSEIYGTWLPVISGFSGSAITFFLRRDK